MKLGVITLIALMLTGCTTPMPKDEFLADYKRIEGRIDYFEAAYAMAYTPRVKENGLQAVNQAVNAVPYVKEAYGANAPLDPKQFWTRGGDCDKYALVKMLELRAQGISDLYYLVLMNGPQNENHAVLVANDHGNMVALDNQSKTIKHVSTLYKNYDPVFAVDVKTRQIWRARVLPPFGT